MTENFRDGDDGDEDEESASHRNNIVGKDEGLFGPPASCGRGGCAFGVGATILGAGSLAAGTAGTDESGTANGEMDCPAAAPTAIGFRRAAISATVQRRLGSTRSEWRVKSRKGWGSVSGKIGFD